ncbi:MAG: hypothetical protein CMP21_01390 [Rickettsiales bacterium]|nr:hypothetical protein [Rickettsiales bacterium]|tara:strand:+ start:9950 stop:10387 length:438 start_codon:yes stop_codon:yes gene_type:complete
MAEKAKKAQIILKRQVVTKAVVTPKFKEFLKYELEENVKFYKNKLADITARLNALPPTDPAAAQAQAEKQEADQYIQSEASQRAFINDLDLDSEYSQGPVEGFVTVSTGDNLYEKLGGVEIIVKDGVITKITASSSQFDKVTAKS